MGAPYNKRNVFLASKPGPKKGWAAELRKERDSYKDEADFLRPELFETWGKLLRLQRTVAEFNRMSTISKVLLILKGWHV